MKRIITILVLTVTLGTLSANAQETKIAHVNTEEILYDLPEYKEMETYVKDAQESLQKELAAFEAKVKEAEAAFMALPEDASQTMKDIKRRDYEDIYQRAQAYSQNKQQEIQTTGGQLQQAMIIKVKDKIQEVCEAEGYTYIIDSSNLLAVNGGNDLTGKVRIALGLPEQPTKPATTPALPK